MNKKRVSVQEIIKKDAEATGADFEKLYTYFFQEIQAGRMRIMRHGNTLMIYSILQPKVAEVHIVSADKPREIIEAIKDFEKAMKKAGFVKVVSDTDNMAIVRLLQAANVPVKVTPMNGKYHLEFGV